MHSLKATFCSVSLSLVGLLPFAVQSCEFHNGLGFGIYSSFHPMKQIQYQQDFEQPLHVTHPSSVNTETNTSSILNIEYAVPEAYQNVVITFSGSEDVTLLSGTKLTAAGVSGSYPLKYKVNKVGNHKISVHINALKREERVDFSQHVTVNAT
ncbi:hypothetical protein KO519_14095 [Paraglaciecola agarilytica]|uniref:hypothetical protein n=1 Tax=Paraglaciecola chathamensis TaxID=368405 RepID=UPI001C08460B|nr:MULTISPECIES: hypothetical protein [Paraglaciecola]MBU3018816.1 hypothetical protein [Paraglaciecola agarilytica]MDO6559945.1 hypothetical protein [Paraglaciecola chathamensis]|tara:strand:+ start:1453 stop:1911 length:459 start_codon:yes stop_codon:yes gene_type:complete